MPIVRFRHGRSHEVILHYGNTTFERGNCVSLLFHRAEYRLRHKCLL